MTICPPGVTTTHVMAHGKYMPKTHCSYISYMICASRVHKKQIVTVECLAWWRQQVGWSTGTCLFSSERPWVVVIRQWASIITDYTPPWSAPSHPLWLQLKRQARSTTIPDVCVRQLACRINSQHHKILCYESCLFLIQIFEIFKL